MPIEINSWPFPGLRGCVAAIFAGMLLSCTAEPMKHESSGGVVAVYGLKVELSPLKSRLKLDEPMELLFSLKNQTSEPAQILPWGTPLEDILSADIFTVIHSGKELSYTGRMVKRAKPQQSDYLSIAAGETVQQTVQLSEAYDVSEIGTYRVKFVPLTGIQAYQLDEQQLLLPSEPVVFDRTAGE
ncbi:hypothetical protein AB833_28740 [Chromatiales bacterium (ex Bugula neritina AB1)]|nr:hypothetical protein AB833_28740 [Chromatiales bacterium (ex Bugula neritina AB1)]